MEEVVVKDEVSGKSNGKELFKTPTCGVSSLEAP